MHAASVFQARSAHIRTTWVDYQAAFSFRYERLGSIMSYFFEYGNLVLSLRASCFIRVLPSFYPRVSFFVAE